MKATFFFPMALLVLVSDIITKAMAEANLLIHQPQPVLGEFLRWTLTYNRGAAFGITVLGSSRWIYVGLTGVILVTLWGMYRDADARDRWQAIALGMIVGGALGNLYDRLRWTNGVVDFIDVGTPTWRFWTFNIADAGITVGACLMVLLFMVHARRSPTPSSDRSSTGGSGA